MNFVLELSMVGVVVGMIAVAANPSPYFAALGLVLVALCGCWLLVWFNLPFLSLVLLLIYLGAMLVVFAYSAALAAEPYPEAWGSWSVLMYVVFYVGISMMMLYLVGVNINVGGLGGSFVFGSFLTSWGVGVMYTWAGGFLIASGWVLFLVLFAILEITRGVSLGALRAV
uniref:NADH-ubiquinone oxidoreductase chain 6 n=1 Tax=Proteus anguinus TaxID=221568 RepID=C9DHH1_PROAG|nr:NADH dehydrogenase subunit 6 [Proteus anguinus]ACU00376.1 NADH dehydrogenase subunit 6 [Proteus anguinus]